MECIILETEKVVVLKSESRTHYLNINNITDVWCERDTKDFNKWSLVINAIRTGIYRCDYNKRSKAEEDALQIMTIIAKIKSSEQTITI